MPKLRRIAVVNSLILDTNILVSALIGSSYPKMVVFDCVITKKIPICVSESILKEYHEVLGRKKFDKITNFRAKAEKLLENIEKIAEFYEPTMRLNVISDDTDNRFLELGIAAHADFIITGNFTDFTFAEFEGIKIVSPKYFYENYCQ